MAWSVTTAELPGPVGLRLSLECDGRAATFAETADGWRDDAALRSLFSATLADLPWEAVRWELPALTLGTQDRPFECVVLDAPDLVVPAEPEPFAEHFDRAGDAPVVVFPNLGGDAVLVVPVPVVGPEAYSNLADFARGAPEDQQHALWRAVGEALEARLGDEPVWLSTAGGGVAWLHVRLDDRPKYYAFAPYRDWRDGR